MRNEVLRLEKVTLRERGATQLDNLNLHIFEGEILGLVPIDTHGLTALCDLLRENLPLLYTSSLASITGRRESKTSLTA